MIAQTLEAFLPVDTAICMAAVAARRQGILDVAGLSIAVSGIAALLCRLWLQAYFG